MVESDGNYYIAIRYSSTSLDYYRVRGNTRVVSVSDLSLRAANDNLYDIDGRGYLYYNNTSSEISAVTPNGTTLGPISLASSSSVNVNGILAFNDRVLAIDSADTPNVYDVYINNLGQLAKTNNPLRSKSHSPPEMHRLK